MIITVCVIAYNEEKTINSILNDILLQDYNHKSMEILLVDSASTDGTKKIMEEFKEKYQEQFLDVKIADNPKRILPAGWNVALKEYSGEAILKVDAHASIPKEFVRLNVESLEEGEYITGGRRPNVIVEPTKWKHTLLLAESSMFGSSIAPYRNNPGKKYVNSMFHAAYRREVFEKIGGFNENLIRTEDNEIHYRIREAGFKLLFNPQIVSYQHTRSSLGKMLRQKYANGYWIGLTSRLCPKCLSLYHFVPFLFVLAIILSVLGVGGFSLLNSTVIGNICLKTVVLLTGLMWSMYGVLALAMTVIAIIGAAESRNVTNICLPVLFLLLHLSYGIGTLVGLIKSSGWLKGLK